MINKKFAILFAAPLLLSGCVIIDADDGDFHRSISVLHLEGESAKAAGEASRECAKSGDEAVLVEMDMVSENGKVRSVFECA